MPTIFTHAIVPLAAGIGLGRQRISRPLLWAGCIAAMLPDLDVIGFRLHIAYASDFGHRGVSHSLFFALVLGMLAASQAARLKTRPALAFCWISFSAASHGLLDMLTNGGLGVAWWWPLTDQRYFFPWRVIQVSPLKLQRFLDPDAIGVISSELLWV